MSRCEGKQGVCKHVHLSVETRGPQMLLTSLLERVLAQLAMRPRNPPVSAFSELGL